MELEHLPWTDVRDYLARCRTIIVPLGSYEQHGPGLPLGTDAIIAQALAREAGAKSDRLVAPVLAPGVSLIPHMLFPGTISLRTETFTRQVFEVLKSLHHHGFRNFLLVNGHGGNDAPITNALVEARYELDDIKVHSANWWRMEDVAALIREELGRPVGHGCGAEASLVWHIRPDLIDPGRFASDFKGRSFLVSNNLSPRYFTQNGIMNGDQRQASPELGRKLFQMAVENYRGLLQELEDD